MGEGKRGSGPPRRPRNPVAKQVRTPLYRPRVVPDKRWETRVRQADEQKDEQVDQQADDQTKERLENLPDDQTDGVK